MGYARQYNSPLTVRKMHSDHLSVNGDGTGTTNANVDGSTTPVKFWLECTTGVIELHRLIVYVQDAGNFSATDYGTIATLANGVEVQTLNSGGTLLSHFDHTIKSNAEWAAHCFDIDYISFGTGDNSMAVRWTFSKGGHPIILQRGEQFAVTVNDDLTGLTTHSLVVQFTEIL